MATLKSPYGKAVIEVPDELVERYTAAGWVDPPKRGGRPKKTEQDEK